MVRAFDSSRLQLKGEAFSIDKLAPRAGIPGGSFSPSRNGALLISSPSLGNQMTWLTGVVRGWGQSVIPACTYMPRCRRTDKPWLPMSLSR